VGEGNWVPRRFDRPSSSEPPCSAEWAPPGPRREARPHLHGEQPHLPAAVHGGELFGGRGDGVPRGVGGTEVDFGPFRLRVGCYRKTKTVVIFL
jgi:hypothetical protein